MVGTKSGQLLLVALSGQLARIFRRVSLRIPEAEISEKLICRFGGRGDFGRALSDHLRLVNPLGRYERGGVADGKVVSVFVGNRPAANYDFYVGMKNAIGMVSTEPVISECRSSGSAIGAGVASCLATAAILRKHLELPFKEHIELSGWNYLEGAEAAYGPEKIEVVDVGKTLLVGAGAVASSMVFWLNSMGVGGSWWIVDKDTVEIENVSQSLLYLPSDSDWNGSSAKRKVDVLAPFLPNSKPLGEWYDECSALKRERFDVVLCLANDRDVRSRISQWVATVVLHATTGRNWVSVLHRHIGKADDCIRCRTRDVRNPTFACSTGVVVNGESGIRHDASLPFLSGASGLMLATALQRLQSGLLAAGAANEWRWDFGSAYQFARLGQRRCSVDCEVSRVPVSLRKAINSGSRWTELEETPASKKDPDN